MPLTDLSVSLQTSCWLYFWCSGMPVLVGFQVTCCATVPWAGMATDLMCTCALGTDNQMNRIVYRMSTGQPSPAHYLMHLAFLPSVSSGTHVVVFSLFFLLDHKSPIICGGSACCPPAAALLPLYRHDVKICWMQSWAAICWPQLQHLGPALRTMRGLGCHHVYTCWQQTWCQVSLCILYISNPLTSQADMCSPPEGNATEFGGRMKLYSQNSTSNSCMQGAMLWATTQTSLPASTIANLAVAASSNSQTTAGIVAAALSSVQGANVTVSNVSLLLAQCS